MTVTHDLCWCYYEFSVFYVELVFWYCWHTLYLWIKTSIQCCFSVSKVIAWGARKSDHHYALFLVNFDSCEKGNGSCKLRDRFRMNVGSFWEVTRCIPRGSRTNFADLIEISRGSPDFSRGSLPSTYVKPECIDLVEISQNVYLAMQVDACTVILGCADHSAASLHSASSAPRSELRCNTLEQTACTHPVVCVMWAHAGCDFHVSFLGSVQEVAST